MLVSVTEIEPSEDLTVVTLSFNCLTFTASVSFSPALTPVIVLLPALMPSFLTDGPPAIVKPSLLTVVSPIFTEPSLVRSRSLDN